MLRRTGQWDSDASSITFIRETLGAQEAVRLGFDIVYKPATGATYGVPTGLAVQWNAQQRTLEAATLQLKEDADNEYTQTANFFSGRSVADLAQRLTDALVHLYGIDEDALSWRALTD